MNGEGKNLAEAQSRKGGEEAMTKSLTTGDTGCAGEEFSPVAPNQFVWQIVAIARRPEPDEYMFLPCFKGLALKPEVVATYESDDIGYMNVLMGVTHVRSGMALGSFSSMDSAVMFLSALSRLPVDWDFADAVDIRSDAWKETREQVLAIRRKLEARELMLEMRRSEGTVS